jgi:hypothetical protein
MWTRQLGVSCEYRGINAQGQLKIGDLAAFFGGRGVGFGAKLNSLGHEFLFCFNNVLVRRVLLHACIICADEAASYKSFT